MLCCSHNSHILTQTFVVNTTLICLREDCNHDNEEYLRTFLEKHQQEVQNEYGAPTALRLQGTSMIKFPYTGDHYDYPPPPGHVEAICEDRDTILTIGEREFVPSYGLTIFY